jgi:hypothetical protein
MAAGCDQEMTFEIELSVPKTCGLLRRQAEGFLLEDWRGWWGRSLLKGSSRVLCPEAFLFS